MVDNSPVLSISRGVLLLVKVSEQLVFLCQILDSNQILEHKNNMAKSVGGMIVVVVVVVGRNLMTSG